MIPAENEMIVKKEEHGFKHNSTGLHTNHDLNERNCKQHRFNNTSTNGKQTTRRMHF